MSNLMVKGLEKTAARVVRISDVKRWMKSHTYVRQKHIAELLGMAEAQLSRALSDANGTEPGVALKDRPKKKRKKEKAPRDVKRLLQMRVMRERGMTYKEIAEAFGLSQPSVFLYLKRWEGWEPEA